MATSTAVPFHKIVFLRPGHLPSALLSDHAAAVDMISLGVHTQYCIPGNKNSTQGSAYTGQVPGLYHPSSFKFFKWAWQCLNGHIHTPAVWESLLPSLHGYAWYPADTPGLETPVSTPPAPAPPPPRSTPPLPRGGRRREKRRKERER